MVVASRSGRCKSETQPSIRQLKDTGIRRIKCVLSDKKEPIHVTLMTQTVHFSVQSYNMS